MEFTPTCDVYQHTRSHKNEESELKFVLSGAATSLACEHYNDDLSLIFAALESIFAFDISGKPQGKPHSIHELILYRKAQHICFSGRSLELLEAVDRKLTPLIGNCTRSLVNRVRLEPSNVISTVAEIWSHFVAAVNYTSRILLYSDKKYMHNTGYHSWRQYCIHLFNHNMSAHSHIFDQILSAILSRLLEPKRQEMEFVLDHLHPPTETSPVDPQMRTVVQMLLDLGRYEGAFIDAVLHSTQDHYHQLLSDFQSSPKRFPWGPKFATYLVCALVQESSRFLYYFHETSEKDALKCLLSEFLAHEGAGILEEKSLEPPPSFIYKAEFPIEVQSKSALMDLILSQQDSLLQVVFFALNQASLFAQFASAWGSCIHNIVKAFLDHYFSTNVTYDTMSDADKLTCITSFLDLTDRMSRLASTTLDTQLLKPRFTNSPGMRSEVVSHDFITRAKERILSFNVHDESLTGVLQTRTREALTSALNANRICSQTLAKCFVFYLDYVLRHGLQGAGEAQFKVMLRRLIVLFRSLEAKILIGTLHEAAMAQRFFTGKARFIPIERQFVQLLSDECGEAFVQRMLFVMSEYETSSGFAAQFSEQMEVLERCRTGAFEHCEFRVIVVPTQVWPKRRDETASAPPSSEIGEIRRATETLTYDVNIRLPLQITACAEEYTRFYRRSFENRVLKFSLHDSSATVRFSPSTTKKVYHLSVNAFQAFVLLEFNSRVILSHSDVRKIFGSDESDLMRETMESLSDNPGKQVLLLSESNEWSVNHEFQYSRPYVPMKTTKAQSRTERDNCNEVLAQARTEQISLVAVDAFVVKYLKSKKSASFNEIFSAIVNASIGAPVMPDILQARLQHLVTKDFLSKENTSEVYTYEA